MFAGSSRGKEGESKWHFIGLMPLFDPPRHESVETIKRVLNLDENIKMITGMVNLRCRLDLVLESLYEESNVSSASLQFQ